MAIPENQLEVWSRQGSIAQSKATSDSVRAVLHERNAPYAPRNFDTFLQGSYVNDTNIYADSDVDIVIRLDSTYHYSISELDHPQKEAFNSNFSLASYSYDQFRGEVLSHLRNHYGSSVRDGAKAIFIQGSGARRDADVLPASVYYKYTRYLSAYDYSRTEGICFWSNGVQIINYPKQHSDNCTRKHQSSGHWFKPTGRVIKNMRNRMIQDGLIDDSLAPSYFLEGMIYNVPNNTFGPSYQSTIQAILTWLSASDRDALLCANEQYYLLNPISPVTWRREKFEAFLSAAWEFWRNWRS